MNVRIIDGNVLDSTADIIAHQVNCQFVMGAGVAKAISRKYPHVYLSYKKLRRNGDLLKSDSSQFLGRCHMAAFTDPKDKKEQDSNHFEIKLRYIANLFGQDQYGNDGKQYTNYQALQCSLYSMKRWALFNPYGDVKTIAFPYGMGAGLGGGDWDVISKMIEDTFRDTDIEIQYWKLR